YGQGDLHFVTFSCYRRRPSLGTSRARDCFVKILDEVRRRHEFRLVGYVVMPEHVHLLISEAGRKNPSKILQLLKQKVARALLKKRRTVNAGQLPFPFEETGDEEAHFWQRRFYDFNVWSEKKLKEKLEYMHANPVQRKLVEHPKDWPWSSWADYAGEEDVKIRMDEVRGDRDGSSGSRKSQNPHP
ncbi:MAG: transposase, partial [Candidatus Acidiferrum sp.]